MIIRTAEQLNDALDREFAWRKKELRVLRAQLVAAKDSNVGTASRAAVALAYAHLEGFFKAAATIYLKFLSNQPAMLSDLHPNFQSLCVSHALHRKFSGKVPTDIVVLVEELLSFVSANSTRDASIPHKNQISTQSNLNSEVMRSILVRVGLPATMFELRERQLDEGLLKSRNHVAHGQYLECAREEVADWVDMVLDMCERFRTELDNSAALKRWRRDGATPAAV